MVQFSNWIFGLIAHLKERDSYKDTQGKGLVERYVQSIGEELDAEFIPFANGILNLIDPAVVPERLLSHLSFILGIPPSISPNIQVYRKVLAIAVEIYKVKGTKISYQMLFNLLGIDIDIIEEPPKGANRYDDAIIYDDGFFYDDDCENCTYYSIVYNSMADTTDPLVINDIPDDVFDLFNNIICFLQPINAKHRGYIRRIRIEEEFELNLDDRTLGFAPPGSGEFGDDFDDDFDIGDDPDPGESTDDAMAPPDNFRVTGVTDTTIKMEWDEVTDGIYVIQRSLSLTFLTFTTVYTGDDLEFTDSGLSPNTKYYYRIRTTNPPETPSIYTNLNQKTNKGIVTLVLNSTGWHKPPSMLGFTFFNVENVLTPAPEISFLEEDPDGGSSQWVDIYENATKVGAMVFQAVYLGKPYTYKDSAGNIHNEVFDTIEKHYTV